MPRLSLLFVLALLFIFFVAIWWQLSWSGRVHEGSTASPQDLTTELLTTLDQELQQRMARFLIEVEPMLDPRAYLEVARGEGESKDAPFEPDDISLRRAKVLARFDALRSAFPQFFCEMFPAPEFVESYRQGVLFLSATKLPLPTQESNIYDNPPTGTAMLISPHETYKWPLTQYLRHTESTNVVLQNREQPNELLSGSEHQINARPPSDADHALDEWTRKYPRLFPAGHDALTESSECLYLILANPQLGESILDELPDWCREDTDGDGLLELIDAWGRPLRFYRWPTDYWAYLIDVVAECISPFHQGLDQQGEFVKHQYWESVANPWCFGLDRERLLFRSAWFDPLWWHRRDVPFGLLRENNSQIWQLLHFRIHQLYDIRRDRPDMELFVVADKQALGRDMGFGVSQRPIKPEEGLDNFPRKYPIQSLIVSAGADGRFGLYTPDCSDAQGDTPRSEGTRGLMWSAAQLDYRCGRVDSRYLDFVSDNILSAGLDAHDSRE